MQSNRTTTSCLLLITAMLLIPALAVGQQSGDLQIEAKPLPGQLDVLQGTAFQLGGTPPDKGPKPTSYTWGILEGEGGELINADRTEAIFRAPVMEDQSMEVFVIQLTAEYQGQKPATAQLHVRVHKELPEKTADQAQAEDEMVITSKD